jgi:hypothetical protein
MFRVDTAAAVALLLGSAAVVIILLTRGVCWLIDRAVNGATSWDGDLDR